MIINDYRFGYIKINDTVYKHDVIIFKSQVNSWWRVSGHEVVIKDIEELVDNKPEMIIFGQGDPGLMKVSSEVKRYLNDNNIEMLELPTMEAVSRFNELIKTRDVAGAFHLTC
jgi:hypothetical protein